MPKSSFTIVAVAFAIIAVLLMTAPPMFTLGILILSFNKNFPFVYTLRHLVTFLYYRMILRTPLDPLGGTASHHMVVLPGDIDFQFHMNNSVYNLESEFCRAEWHIRTRFVEHCRSQKWRVSNGGVSFQFLRELRLFEIYRTRTRLIAFDKKWIGLETVFETGPLASPVTHAVGFCRVVVKESSGSQKGKTVSPEDVFRRIGLEESDVAALKVEHLRDVKKCLCSY